MADLTQQNRRFRVTTALGEDAVLLTGFRGTEAISQLFSFELDLLAPLDAPADFGAVLGQSAVVDIDLPNGQKRYIHGIISRFTQGRRDETFIHYRAELVPALWLLTKREQSRIFQHMTAKQVLSQVIDVLPVRWLVKGDLPVRDYCVQYRETDFSFISRLMEEEGIYYYFTHTVNGPELVLGDTPQGHDPIPVEATLVYEETGGSDTKEEFIVRSWDKVQELSSGKVTLWDHHFELPHKHLDAEQSITDAIKVGTVEHNLQVGPTESLERYDYPGGYADWFDGVDSGGAEQPADLEHIFKQNQRQAKLRMQAEAAVAVRADGTSICANLTPGHKFELTTHYIADGEYLVTSVTHEAYADGDFQSGGVEYHYDNSFECLPLAAPFRPARQTQRPTVKGTQTAVVVGPAGDEIFTDKYGRIKVQFHWDRDGKYDADSSCWIRVATVWAGSGWGVIHIPRIGHEVVVDFLEGDPDRPIVIGSVYNADHIPPGNLPKEGMVSGTMSRTTPKGGASNFNGMRANDTKGKEGLTVQAEYDMNTLVKHNDDQKVLVNRTVKVDGTHSETIKGDTTYTVSTGNFVSQVLTGTSHTHVVGAVESKFDATSMATVTGAVSEHYNDSLETIVKNGIHIASTAAHIYIHTATSIQLHVGASSIWMDSGGQIALRGKNIILDGSVSVSIHGDLVRSSADTSHEISGGNVKSEAKSNNVVKGAMVMLNP